MPVLFFLFFDPYFPAPQDSSSGWKCYQLDLNHSIFATRMGLKILGMEHERRAAFSLLHFPACAPLSLFCHIYRLFLDLFNVFRNNIYIWFERVRVRRLTAGTIKTRNK